MSIAVALENRTPFASEVFLLPDGHGQELHLLVLKASFDIGSDGLARPTDDQQQISLVDEYWGTPGASSLIRDHDLALGKPMVDITVHGCAHAPGGHPTEHVIVELRIAGIQKRLLVSGERRWSGDAPTAAAPFIAMPLVWERAYGGNDEPRNPVGNSGELGPPNIEHPSATITRRGQRGRPAGFGPIARTWQPRPALAGTYDQTWLNRRWPLVPEDHDPLWNQSAPEDQRLTRLDGGEVGMLINMTRNGPWYFRVPRLDIPVYLFHSDREQRAELRVDTLEIEPDASRLTLVARFALPVVQDRGPLHEIVLGHVQRGWLRARRLGKRYVDLHGNDGANNGRACFLP